MLTALHGERTGAALGVLVLCTRRHGAAEPNPRHTHPPFGINDFRHSMAGMDSAANNGNPWRKQRDVGNTRSRHWG